MSRKNIFLGCVVVTTLALGVTACSASVETAANPNSNLPVATASSAGCEALDKVLEQEFKTSVGMDFITAQQTPDDGTDLEKSEQRSKEVETRWVAFLDHLNQGETQQRLVKAAGNDSAATAALEALDKYTQAARRLSSGEVSQYADPEAAQLAFKEGKTPEENPEFVELSNQLLENHAVLTGCLPHWPVTF